MAKMDIHNAGVEEVSTQKGGKTGGKVKTKPGPATRGQPMHPNAGEKGGVFRAARGKVS